MPFTVPTDISQYSGFLLSAPQKKNGKIRLFSTASCLQKSHMIYYFPIFNVDGFTTRCHLLGGQFITSLKSNLCTALPRQNTTENNSINSHALDKTALQASVF